MSADNARKSRLDYIKLCQHDALDLIRQEAEDGIGKDALYTRSLSATPQERLRFRMANVKRDANDVIVNCDAMQLADTLIRTHISSSSASASSANVSLEDTISVSDVLKLPGMKYYKNIIEIMKTFPKQPSEHQRLFIRHAIHMMLPVIFDGRTEGGDAQVDTISDWDKYKKTICKVLGFSGDIAELGLLISTPRQLGKTEAMVMIATAMALCIPGFFVLSVSTSQRISIMFAQRVHAYIANIPDIKKRIISQTKEEIVFSPITRPGDASFVSKIMTLPSNATTLRGLWGHLLLVDEAGFTNKDLLVQFIFPLLKVPKRKVLCISTPATSSISFFTSAIRKSKEVEAQTGRKGPFEVVIIEAMCPDCASKRKQECPHRDSVATPWSSNASERALKDILGSIDPDAFNREVLGADVDSKVPAFPRDLTELVFSSPRYLLDTNVAWRPPCVFVSIDPSGGGNSDVAIVSFFYTKDNQMVVSILFLLTCQNRNQMSLSSSEIAKSVIFTDRICGGYVSTAE